MSFSAHSAFLCDRLLNMFCSAAYKLAPPFGHIKVELCPGLEPNSWTKSAKPQCLCGIILFVLLYRNHRCGARFRLLSYIKLLAAYYCTPIICQIFGFMPQGSFFSAGYREDLRFNSAGIARSFAHRVLLFSIKSSILCNS